MKLGHFLDAGYAMLHGEYQRMGMNLFDATEQLVEWRAGWKSVGDLPIDEAITEDRVARENARALAELQSLMAGSDRRV